MRFVAPLLSILALAFAAAGYRNARDSSGEIDALHASAERMGDRSNRETGMWPYVGSTERTLPLLRETPEKLPGTRRLEWTDSGLSVWGPSKDECSRNHGLSDGLACVFPANPQPLPRNSDVKPVPFIGRAGRNSPRSKLEMNVARLDGHLQFTRCKATGDAEGCDVELTLPVPTLAGVAVILGRLQEWPFVPARFAWDGNHLSVAGFLMGKE